MKMPKRKTLASVEAKIRATQQKIAAAKTRYNRLCSELAALEHERDEIEARAILTALRQSGKTYRELMTFLGK